MSTRKIKTPPLRLSRFPVACCAAGILLARRLSLSAAENPVSPAPALAATPVAVAPASTAGEYSLADFGPVKTAVEAQAALDTAIAAIIANGGGVLFLGPGVCPGWRAENNAPSSTKSGTSTVTVVDRRGGRESVLVPSNGRSDGSGVWAGQHVSRTVRQPIDMAFGVHSTESIDTQIAGGTTSFYFPCLADIKKGKDQRIYVPTIRGLFEGMRMVLYAPEKQEEVIVKALGWDAEKKLSYAVADIAYDHPKGQTVGDKHVVNSLTITDHSQSDNQSMGLLVSRKNYALGDSFVISASARSMSNIMSCTGDEGGLCYGADIYNDLQPFRSKVAAIDWKASELVYEPGYTRNHTLGTSRPLLNLNPQKHVTQGTVYMVAPGNKDPWDTVNPDKTGKLFAGQLFPGGAIIGSKECGWTDAVIGRFFALDEPDEYLDPKNDHGAGYTGPPDLRTYRWYEIQKRETRADGTQRLFVERTRWFSRNDIVPKLYRADNYSWDGHLKPLRYLIAPGAYVADVSRAWTNSESSGGRVDASSPRTLKLAPSPDAGGPFDFAKGDAIVQAIGQDPWNPTGLRVRHHNYLPSTIEDSSFQAVNNGRVAVDSGLAIHGGGTDIEDSTKNMKDGQPRFLKGIDIGGTTTVGIRFGADVADAAIKFEQPHKRPQPIVWNTAKETPSSLVVDPNSGDFLFRGGTARVPGVIVGAGGGISGSATPARNLRGIAVAVKAGATELAVRFERPEADTAYAIQVQPNWLSTSAISAKTEQGFTVVFDKAAPAAATLDWILVR